MDTRFQLIPARAAGAPARPALGRGAGARVDSPRQRHARSDAAVRASALRAHPAQGDREARRPLAYLPSQNERGGSSPDTAARPAGPKPVVQSATDTGAHPQAGERAAGRLRRFMREEHGAVTAEYAIVILAAVAFAGLLVAIMQSAEIRGMLVELVENALGSSE